MGRMKVYGGSWDLPGVPEAPHHFVDDLVCVEDDTPIGYFGNLPLIEPPRLAPSPRVPPATSTIRQEKPATTAPATTITA